jgi:N-acylneuraminate cytidylyltransferase
MNPWWAVRLDDRSRPRALFPEAFAARSQDLPPLYCPTGAIWVARVPALEASRSFYGPSHVFHALDWKAAVDIDDQGDLEMAQVIKHITKKETVGTRA